MMLVPLVISAAFDDDDDDDDTERKQLWNAVVLYMAIT